MAKASRDPLLAAGYDAYVQDLRLANLYNATAPDGYFPTDATGKVQRFAPTPVKSFDEWFDWRKTEAIRADILKRVESARRQSGGQLTQQKVDEFFRASVKVDEVSKLERMAAKLTAS